MIEIVLLERVERLGQMGDVVRVKPGYARNFLLPLGKALRATKENLSVFESRRAQLEAETCTARTKRRRLLRKWRGSQWSSSAKQVVPTSFMAR
jgi:large subunit ribosomal protein L9